MNTSNALRCTIGLTICWAGCGRSPEPDEMRSPRSAVELCRIADRVERAFIECEPSPRAKAMMEEGRQRLAALARAHPAEAGLDCALLLVGRMDIPSCPVPMTPAERRLIDDAFSARARPPRTGDPAIDGAVTRMVALRDRMCRCPDAACATQVDREIDHLIDDVAATVRRAPPAVRDAVGETVSEASRCKLRVEAERAARRDRGPGATVGP